MSFRPVLPSLGSGYDAAIMGATGAIGGALATLLDADPACARVWRLGRSMPKGEGIAVDLCDEASIAAAALRLSQDGVQLKLLFIATGALTINGQGPEKALRHLDPAALAAQFALNAIGPALVLKHFTPLLARRERALVAALSARVGSIGDNRLGGWAGYRSAKAALNQIMRTAAVELKRTHPQAVVAALHPGTVESPLTAPFRPEGAMGAGVLTPRESATRLLGVLDGLIPAESGCFRDWRGAPVEW